MARYDWGWTRGYDRGRSDYGAGRGRGYASDFGSWGDAWGSAPSAGFRGRSVGQYRNWGTPLEAGASYGGGYDREFGGRGGYPGGYGGDYPAYGGYPGGRERGMYYGGRAEFDRGFAGYDRGFGMSRTYTPDRFGGGMRGRGGPPEMGRAYDRNYATEPFMPEEAYRRHPEYSRPQPQMRGRWPDAGHELGAGEVELEDNEIRQAVRQNLYNDSWVSADNVQVEVSDGVVTLTGEVADYMEARYAWDDAWESAGVRGVVNHLTVRTDQPSDPHGEVLPQTEGGRNAPGGAGM